MKSAKFCLLVAPLLAAIGRCASSAHGAELPAWVEATKEPLVLNRSAPPAYLEITQTVTIARPKALTKIDELEKLNPGLTQALPALRGLIEGATVSPKFKKLYDTKIDSVKNGDWLSSGAYFDCATVLNLKGAKSGRSAVLFQSDMDTCTDGSDPDRFSLLSDYNDARLSRSYQPILAYSWPKAPTDTATSPFLKYYDDTLGQLRDLKKQVDGFVQADRGAFWPEVQKYFDEALTRVDKRAAYFRPDLLKRRSLVASVDPYIVIPSTWVDDKLRVGDYAAVIYGGKIYPALIGDTGPTTKAGEASQKLAQALNPKATGRVSAITNVGVTYLVFPGTRAEMGTPDWPKYEKEVARLLAELCGPGSDLKLHSWSPAP